MIRRPPRSTLDRSSAASDVYKRQGWNSGLTILGMQDQTRTQAVAATGKNATVWGSAAMDSCFRFTPSGGVSKLKSAQLVVDGVVAVSYTHLRAHETVLDLVCRLLLEKKNQLSPTTPHM